MSPGVTVAADGRARCAWSGSAPEYLAYHDQEWGQVVHGEAALFERLSLEAFQSGLSWLTVLRKRQGFRAAFAGFDPTRVARFTSADVERMVGDPAIIRNRAKILATVANARATLALRDTVDGGLDALVWSFAPAGPRRPARPEQVPALTAASTALAGALRQHGFAFVGPRTAYATMQACGLVDDHLNGCWVRAR